MFYKTGTLLSINGIEGKVIGYIQYKNTEDGDKTWIEYRLRTTRGECWLSCDEFYNEYSISWPANDVRGQIGPEWHKVDEGTQVVTTCGGDVDVDPGERASFVEYEDEAEEHILSVEAWSDGSEFSRGEYIEKSDIIEKGYEYPHKGNGGLPKKMVAYLCIFFLILIVVMLIPLVQSGDKIQKYIKASSRYVYETSITGKQKQEADVYSYYTSATTDDVAKDIIGGIEGDTESVTQKDDISDEEIAILTDKEYCLVYHPESEPDVVYVQVSSRKYNYTSDNAPYRSSAANATWYRNHYYSSGYSSDASSYHSTPSAYSMYNGTTVHNIGNGYFDSYSSTVRQSSINSRSSSGGGMSSGK